MCLVGNRMFNRHLALIACACAGIVACRGFVDALFEGEQPEDGKTDYALQIVRGQSSSKGLVHYVETVAPSVSYLAVRIVNGEVDTLDPTLASSTSSFCVMVAKDTHQYPIVVRGDAATTIIAALYEPVDEPPNEAAAEAAASDLSPDAADPCSADRCATAGCDIACVRTLSLGICPKGMLQVARIRPLLVVDDASAAMENDAGESEGGDASEPDSADATSAPDAFPSDGGSDGAEGG